MPINGKAEQKETREGYFEAVIHVERSRVAMR